MMARPGEDERPWRGVDELESLLEHPAPARSGRLLADAEEAEAGLGEEGEAERQCELDDDRRGDVRHDVTSDEALRGGPETPGRLDVGLLADGDHLAPEEAHEARDEHDGDGDGGVVDVGTEQGGHRQRQDQRGEGEQGVHRPHDHGVDRTPEEPGHEAERDGDDGRQAHDLEGRPQRDASTPDQPAEDVAPEVVGPEPVRRRGPGVDGVDVLGVRAACGAIRGAKMAATITITGRPGRRWPSADAGSGPRTRAAARGSSSGLSPVSGMTVRPTKGSLASGGSRCSSGGPHDSRIFGFR